MRGFILYKREDYEKNAEYVQLYFDAFSGTKVQLSLVILEELTVELSEGRVNFYYQNVCVKKPHFVINRTNDFLLAESFESFGIRVFNNSTVSRMANDKRLAYSVISKIPNVCIARTLTMSNRGGAFFEDENFVAKRPFSRSGKDVFDIDSESEFDPYGFLLQEKIADSRDLRVYIIGKKNITSILRSGKNSFKSNFSLGGDCEVYSLSESEKKLVERIINAFDFDFVGIDFLFNDGDLLFNEIEDSVGSRMVYKLTDIDIVKVYCDYILEKMQEDIS